MKYSIVCSSLTGNTKTLADGIYAHLGKADCLYFGQPDLKASDGDIIYVGFWTDMGTCNKEIKEFLLTLKNKNIFLFGTCGFGTSQDYFNEVIKHVLENVDASNHVIGSFMCQGQMKPQIKEKYLKMKKAGLPNADLLLKNYEMGQGHPNKDDIAHLIKLIK